MAARRILFMLFWPPNEVLREYNDMLVGKFPAAAEQGRKLGLSGSLTMG
jgi:hypothetical protein